MVTKWINLSPAAIYGMPQCVFSMDFVYEDFGDVDYIDNCGNYMTTFASALALVVIFGTIGIINVR